MSANNKKSLCVRLSRKSVADIFITGRFVFYAACLNLSLLVLSLFVMPNHAEAQCTNADFESGGFGSWTGTYGTNYNNGNCVFSNPTQYTGFLQGPINNPDNDPINHYSHILTTTAGGNDPFLAGNGVNVPVNWPGSGMYSARIGSTWPGTSGIGRGKPDAATMTYTFPVTAADAAFTYHYAVILNVGAGHIPTEQPYFHIRMVTSNGDTITCASFDVDASSARNVGGFDSLIDNGGDGQIYYKNWTSVYIPLYNYIGQTVSIIFTTCSCNPNQCAGKHFAVAYIDAQCGPTTIAAAPHPSCTQPSYTLTAPSGAATYSWSGPGVGAATHSQSISTLQSGLYSVTMTTFGANPCVFTLDTLLTINTPPVFHANFTAPVTCLGSPTTFTDISVPAGQITSRTWHINGDSIPTTSLTPSYTFPTAGTFPVRLTVGDPPCVVDTTLNVVVNAPPTSTFTVTGPVCTGQTSTITYTGNAATTDTYTWNFNGGTIISGSGAGPYQIKWATTGTKNITLTVTARGCPSPVTTHQVVVTPVPTITLSPDVYACGGGTTTLAPVASPVGGTYLWSTNQTTSTITVSPLVTTRYSVVYTLGTCSASVADTVIITKPNAGTDEVVNCAILPGGTATMTGTGTGTWSAMTGNPGTATITNANSPTTTITGFTAAGNYKFIMTNVHGCTDTASVAVTAKPNAGPDQTVNCAILPGGIATMAGTGTGTWSAMTGNPGTTTIATTTSPTTSISTFSSAGTYKFIWTNASGCSDTASIIVTAKPNAGPDQSVNCAVLPGGRAAMAATGAGTWTAMTGNPGSATIASATSPSTIITGFTTAGTYKYIWTNASGCSDTASIVVTAKPNAGPNQTVNCVVLPGGMATMAGTGIGTWATMTGNPGTATIVSATSASTNITTFTNTGTYKFIWTNASGCSDTASIMVTAKPNAGPDQTVNCAVLPGGSATMAAAGAGTWTAMTGNPGVAVITSTTSPTTTITGYTASGTYKFIWTNNSGCSDTASITVTAKPNAGPDQTVNCAVLPGGSATMAGTGTGVWTAMTGNPGTAIVNAFASPTTVINRFTNAGTYNFIWTNASGCSDTASITVTAKPNAGPDQTVSCAVLPGGIATMAGTGVGTWTAMTGNPGVATITSITLPTTTINGFTNAGIYKFIWTNGSGCSDTAAITVTAKPNAGADQTVSCAILPGGRATMAAAGAGTWTAMNGNPGNASITSATSPTTIITGFTNAGTYKYIWTNASGCSDTASITVTAKPNAGSDQTVNCVELPGGFATMLGAGTGTWAAMTGNPGNAAITVAANPTTTITGFTAAGTYKFIWTNASGCSDTASVIVTSKPNAGPDQIVSCAILPGGSATMAATGTGTWTAMTGNPGAATITSSTNPSTTINGFTASGTYKFIWTNASGCIDTTSIVVTAKPNAGPDQTVSCAVLPGGSATMAGTGTGVWTAMSGNPGTATITALASPTSVIARFTNTGTYNFIWTNASGCSDTASITVTAKPNAGADQTVSCAILPGGNATMAGTGTGTWTAMTGNPGTATITSTTSPNTSITGFTNAGTYKFIWTNGSGCSDTASIVVTAKPNAGPDQTVSCVLLPGGSATMAATGTGTWTALVGNPGSSIITTAANPATTITGFTAAGSYRFIWTNVSGCTDTASITITQQPTVRISSAAYCQGGSAILSSTVSPAGGSYLWSTSQTSSSITVNDTTTMNFTLTYTLGSCSAIARDTVTVYTLPSANVTTTPSICTTHNGVAKVHTGIGAYTYSWSNPGSSRDSLSNLAPGTYHVTVTDINHCSSTATGIVGLQTPNIVINEVSQHNLKCFSDVSGEIHISTTDTAGHASFYTDTYNWSNATHNQNLIRVPAGTYHVTVTDQFGCTGTASYTLTQPSALAATTAMTDPHCSGSANGTAIVNPTGGSGSYHYIWNTNPTQNTRQATGLLAGTYTVTMTDDSLCMITKNVTLTNPLAMTFASATVSNPKCHGDSTGTATVIPQHSTGPYTYAWSYRGLTTNPAVSLPGGSYTVTVTDANGCTGSTQVNLTQPTPLLVNVLPTGISCFGMRDGAVSAYSTGGTPPYAFRWNTHDSSDHIPNLSPGAYTITATDNNRCAAIGSVNITEPTRVTDSLSATRTNCHYSNDGTIIAVAHGGSGQFTYTLNDNAGQVLQSGNTTGIFTGLSSGSYQVVATDHNHCPAIDTISIARAALNVYTSSSTPVSCYGPRYHDGSIHVQGAGSQNGPFQYSVDGSPFQYTPDFYDMTAGPHKVTAHDQYGCDTTFTIVVGQPAAAVVQIVPDDTTIAGGASVQLVSTFGPYPADSTRSYVWTPATGLNCTDCTSPLANPYTSTTYTLAVTYNAGCIVTATAQINVNGHPPLYVPNAFSPNGDGVNDVWSIFGTGIKDVKSMIFNRWGEKVFETDDQFQSWDGVYRGERQPTGVYVYLVDVVYLDGETDTRKGSVTLIR